MAVGVSRSERKGPNAIRVSSVSSAGSALPMSTAAVTIEYPGKSPVSEILAKQQTQLDAIKTTGIKRQVGLTPNALIIADNFLGLNAIRNASLRPTLIYLDPPYATGFDFQSRDLEHAYGDQMAPATYLEFMRRRLLLMRDVLADDGSLYLHIGHQMVGQLKVLLDEIFGVRNFRNLIVRKKCSSKNFTRNQYSNLHDYILFYTKSDRYKWNQPGTTPDEAWISKEYPKVDGKGRFKLVPVHAPGVRRGETGGTWRGKLPPTGKHWQYTPSRLEQMDTDGLIHWSKNSNPRRKIYWTDDKQVAMTDYWDRFRDAHHQSIPITGYPTEKNFDLLKLIVTASSDPGDLVVDPFCGSGTTLDAADALGRRWIGIDESMQAARTTTKRLRHGLKAMGDFVTREETSAQVDFLHEAKAQSQVSRRNPADFQLLTDASLTANFQKELALIALI